MLSGPARDWVLFYIADYFSKGQVHFLGHDTDISIWFVVLLGLSNSLIWAGIWPLALDGLGKFTKLGASVLIMGLCGNAILPLAYGYLADKLNVREAYWVLAPCYLYLVFMQRMDIRSGTGLGTNIL